MRSKVKDIIIENNTCYFSDDVVNIKKFDPNNVKINEKSYKNTFMYYIGYVTVKNSKYAIIRSYM